MRVVNHPQASGWCIKLQPSGRYRVGRMPERKRNFAARTAAELVGVPVDFNGWVATQWVKAEYTEVLPVCLKPKCQVFSFQPLKRFLYGQLNRV